MNDEKQALILLGQIDGRLQEQARASADIAAQLRRMEDTITKRLDGHDMRLNHLEVSQARATRQGAWGGTAAGGVVIAAVEIIRAVIGIKGP